MKQTMVFSKLCLAVLCIFGLALSTVVGCYYNDPSIVTVEQGKLQGLVSEDHREFRGVPFAAPPVGDLRFRAPQAPVEWEGVRDATTYCSSCPQLPFISGAPSVIEDCLYLNVFTPLEGKKLPVMVWIHGGSFTTGAGSQFDGSTMAVKGNVIVVTVNYRLGTLGFLALPGLAAENKKGAVGNYGIMDQQAALRWLKKNIANFGGDPKNVTIFGQSAGGGSVCANMASPTAARLFHKAIIQSGGGFADSKEVAYQKGEAIVAAAGCTNSDPAAEVAAMRSLSVEQILAAGGSISLVVDGVTLKSTPTEAFTSGEFNRVPLLQGVNQWEGRVTVFFGFDIQGNPITPDMYSGMINGQYGANAAAVLAEYPLSNYPTPSMAYSAILGDSRFCFTTREQIRLLTSQHIPVYAYHFSDPDAPLPPFHIGPTHSTEVEYVFQDSVFVGETPADLTPAQLALSDQMLSYWTNFARKGNPNGCDLPYWEKYDNNKDAFINLTSVSPGPEMFGAFSEEHHCDFWAGLGL